MACIILDSPFADLRQLANVSEPWMLPVVCQCGARCSPHVSSQELVLTAKEQVGFKIPGLLVKAAIKVIRSAVLKRSGMDIDKLKPIEHVDKSVGFFSSGNVPVVFPSSAVRAGPSSRPSSVTAKMTTSSPHITANRCAYLLIACLHQ